MSVVYRVRGWNVQTTAPPLTGFCELSQILPKLLAGRSEFPSGGRLNLIERKGSRDRFKAGERVSCPFLYVQPGRSSALRFALKGRRYASLTT